MPNNSRLYREKNRKKTRYSSDSDSDRERSRKHREKSYSRSKDRRSRDKNIKESSSRHKERRRRYSSSSSSSDSSGSSSSSRSKRSTSSSSSDRAKSSKSRSSKPSTQQKSFDHITKFEINDLYKEENKGKILDSIEADTFKPESFQSNKKIVVDLKKEKILAPESLAVEEEESLIHPSFLGDEEVKVDKWIKKLHLYRSQ